MSVSELKLKQKLKSISDYKSQGKFLHAIQICEQMLKEFPESASLYFELAELYELSGNLNSSLNLLESYLEINPFDDDARLFLGQFLLKNQMWDKAISIFAEFTPEEKPISLFFLGYAYFMIKDFELARINFLSYIDLEKSSELVYESYLFLTKIEIEFNDFEQALSYAKNTEAFFTSNWELQLILAKCYYNLGMDTHALHAIEKTIKLNPRSTEYYEWAGKIYLRLKEYLKAETYFRKFIETTEKVSSDTFTKLGETCLNMNNLKLALNYFELALRIDPNNSEALQGKQNIIDKNQSN
jgi:tetratricopeptide (TPR) repeat protein